jgi:hypothetical protein
MAEPSVTTEAFHPSVVLDAERTGRRVEVPEPVHLGVDPARDAAVLRILAEATARSVDVEWWLASVPDWPVRAVSHLRPPAGSVDRAGDGFVRDWRAAFEPGACTYRRGPDFIAVRDTRPGGRLRAVLAGPAASTFEALVATVDSPTDAYSRQLLDELTELQFVLRLSATHHAILPYRLPR